jgi:hypothetical protein
MTETAGASAVQGKVRGANVGILSPAMASARQGYPH